MSKEIIFFVSLGRGYGSGHFNRSWILAKALKERNFHIVFFLQASKKDGLPILEKHKEIDALYRVNRSSDFLKVLRNYKPDMVLLDRRNSKAGFLKKLRKISPICSFDDLGAGMLYSNLTIETLPRPKTFKRKELQANYSGLSYLILRKSLEPFLSQGQEDHGISNFSNTSKITSKIMQPQTQKKQVLVSFGTEDPFRLTDWIMPSLKNIQKQDPNIEFKVILGPLYPKKSKLHPSMIWRYGTFEQALFQSDCILTSFGLTVYEALLLGKKVLTLNCSSYHNSLAQTLNGIHNLGYLSWLDRVFHRVFYRVFQDKRVTRRRRDMECLLKKFLLGNSRSTDSFVQSQHNTQSETQKAKPLNKIPKQPLDLGGLERVLSIIQSSIQNQKKDLCSLCGSVPKVMDRTAEWNFYHCFSCHCFFRSSQYSYKEKYSDTYFTQEYQRQYGRTYAEDRDRIQQFNQNRLKQLIQLSPPTEHSPKLLELGSALGFFLSSAREKGYQVEGVEISSYAVQYAKKELKLAIQQGDFKKTPFRENSFDLLVAWYFIEHHPDFFSVLSKMKSLLKEGAHLALSTPNTAGISFWTSPVESAHKIPRDHYIEFSPRSLSLLLKKEGFSVQKITITGVHPNRLAKFLGFDSVQNSFLNKLFSWILKTFHLGDTFEIYAKKNSKKNAKKNS